MSKIAFARLYISFRGRGYVTGLPYLLCTDGFTQPHQPSWLSEVQWTPLTTNNYYYHVRLQYSTFKLIWPDGLTPFFMIS